MTTGFLARAMRLFTAVLTGGFRNPVAAFPIRYHANRQRNALRWIPVFCLLAGLMHPHLDVLGADSAALPRFASLKADEVYMRVGPDQSYPVRWVYVRKGMPVEITEEHDAWRYVRDIEGEEGWIHRVMLSGTRTVIVTGNAMATAYDSPTSNDPVFRAEPGVIGELGPCEEGWCQVTIESVKGWMPMDTLWGIRAEDGRE